MRYCKISKHENKGKKSDFDRKRKNNGPIKKRLVDKLSSLLVNSRYTKDFVENYFLKKIQIFYTPIYTEKCDISP